MNDRRGRRAASELVKENDSTGAAIEMTQSDEDDVTSILRAQDATRRRRNASKQNTSSQSIQAGPKMLSAERKALWHCKHHMQHQHHHRMRHHHATLILQLLLLVLISNRPICFAANGGPTKQEPENRFNLTTTRRDVNHHHQPASPSAGIPKQLSVMAEAGLFIRRSRSGELPAASNQPMVPITVQRRRAASAEPLSASQSEQLVQMQVPLALHLKLKPIALPAPPPTARSLVAPPPLGSASSAIRQKRRRSLQDNSLEVESFYSEPDTLVQSSGNRPGQAMKLLQTKAAINGNNNMQSWHEEAKRALLMNSIAPPLVQAAQRLERRALALLAGGSSGDQLPTSTTQSQPSAATQTQTRATAIATGASKLTTTATKLFSQRPSTESPRTTSTTSSLSTDQDGQRVTLANRQQTTTAATTNTDATIRAISDDDNKLESSNKLASRPSKESNKNRMLVIDWQNGAGSDQAIKSLAATLALPSLVWPSFHLNGPTTSSAGAKEKSTKLRARSLVESGQLQYSQPNRGQSSVSSSLKPSSASIAGDVGLANSNNGWPMLRYTQIVRGHSAQQPGSPVAASEHSPIFVGASEPFEKSTTTTTTTTTTTSTTQRPMATMSSARVARLTHNKKSAKQQSNTRKKRRKANYPANSSSMMTRRERFLAKQANRGNKTEAHNSIKPQHQPELEFKRDEEKLFIQQAGQHHYPLPKIKFAPVLSSPITESGVGGGLVNLNGQMASVGAATQGASNNTTIMMTTGSMMRQTPDSLTPPQLPRSLSKLIEQQLAAQVAAASTSMQRNLTTAIGNQLRQFLTHQQQQLSNNNGSPNAAGSMHLSTTSGKSLAPTTSVSRVIRLASGGSNQTIQLQLGSSSSSSAAATNGSSARAPVTAADKSLATSGLMNSSTQQQRQLVPLVDLKRVARPPESSGGQNSSGTFLAAEHILVASSGNVTNTETSATMTLREPTNAPATTSGVSHETLKGANNLPETTSIPTTTTKTTSTTTTTTKRPGQPTKKFAQDSSRGKKRERKRSREVAREEPISEEEDGQQLEKSHKLHRSQKLQKKATATGNNNIKLFHFNRKPDANKLPFYRRPLNYTELGWTSEQIQEHLRLEAQARAGQIRSESAPGGQDSSDMEAEHSHSNLASSSERTAGDRENDDNLPVTTTTAAAAAADNDDPPPASIMETDATAATVQLLGSPAATDANNSLLKRKRRAKSQFERLMAELQLAAATAALQEQQQPKAPTASSALNGLVPHAADGRQQPETRVPVMRKKQEQLVMKPMFFVMNQKRRRSAADVQAAATAAALAANSSVSAGLDKPGDQPEQPVSMATNPSSNKPIIRMRRKHNNELATSSDSLTQTLITMTSSGDSNDWRPSKPFWSSASSPSQSDGAMSLFQPQQPQLHSGSDPNTMRLMLVPSSLLTPSGSQPVPLLGPSVGLESWRRPAPSDSSSELPVASGRSLDWQLASSPSAQQQQQLAPMASDMDSAKVATFARDMSGPNSKQSDSPMAEQQQQQQQQQQQNKPSTATNNNGDLRVPKLLVKPMRPAKYSLNGYIPKPSLSNAAGQSLGNNGQALAATSVQNQQVQQQHPRAPQQTMANRSTAKKQPFLLSNQQQQHQSLITPPNSFQNKDLDSSTSNEIFSRRRGLQRSLHSGLSANSAGSPTAAGSNNNNNNNNNQSDSNHHQRRSMEENRQRYVQQAHMALKAAIAPQALSVQKVNQLKAKLGLSKQPGIMVKINHKKRSHESESAPSLVAGGNNHQDEDPLGGSPRAAATNRLASHLEMPGAVAQESSARTIMTANELVASNRQQAPLIGAPLSTIPKTDFECTDKQGHFVAGLFADTQTGCQAWHLCSNNRKYSFLCPSGTIFNAKLRICDWRYNVKCESGRLALNHQHRTSTIPITSSSSL